MGLALVCASAALLSSATGCSDDADESETSAGSGGKSSGGNGTGGTKATAGSSSAGSAGKETTGGSGGSSGDTTEPGGAGGEETGGASGAGGAGGDASEATLNVVNASATGHDRFYGTTFDAAGNIYAVGQISLSNDASADLATLVAKFTPEGALDASFGNGGLFVRNVAVGTNGELFRNIVVQSTGKLVAVGTIEHVGATDARDRDVALIRINADGSKDTTFGTDGVVTLDVSTGVVNGTAFSADSAWGLDIYGDDRLVVSGGKVRDAGVDTDFFVARLSADGVLDADFAEAGVFSLDLAVTGVDHNNASPRNVTILPGTDGIIGGGYQLKPGADTSPVLFKLTDSGELDTTFADEGVFHESLLEEQTETYAAVVQPIEGGGYNLVTTGYGRELDAEKTDLVSLRLTSDGEVDTTYGTDGLVRIDVAGFNDNSRRLVVLPDRRIVLIGGGRPTEGNVDGMVAVLTPDGAPDTTFAPDGYKLFDLGGPADFLWGVALSPDGTKLAAAGIRGVGAAPMPPSAADDAVLLLLPTP